MINYLSLHRFFGTPLFLVAIHPSEYWKNTEAGDRTHGIEVSLDFGPICSGYDVFSTGESFVVPKLFPVHQQNEAT